MGGRAADRRFESEGVQSSDPGGGDRELARGSRQCRRCRGGAKEEDAVVDLVRVGKAQRAHHATSRWREMVGTLRFAPPYGSALDFKQPGSLSPPSLRGAKRRS